MSITVLQDEGGLHRLHSELPGPPARARRPHHLAVGQPGHGLEVVPAGQRLGLGVVHRHPVELVEAARVVEVHVGSHGQQRPARRVVSGRAVPQEAGGVQVLREATQPQAGVDHHVLLGAPHQPDVGAVARLVEAFLNPENAVAQGLVGVPLERRHAARGMAAQAERGFVCARARVCMCAFPRAVWTRALRRCRAVCPQPGTRRRAGRGRAGDAAAVCVCVCGELGEEEGLGERRCLARPPAPSRRVRGEQTPLSPRRGAGTIAAVTGRSNRNVNARANAVVGRSRK